MYNLLKDLIANYPKILDEMFYFNSAQKIIQLFFPRNDLLNAFSNCVTVQNIYWIHIDFANYLDSLPTVPFK